MTEHSDALRAALERLIVCGEANPEYRHLAEPLEQARAALAATPPSDDRGHVHRHPTGSPMYHDECDLTDHPTAASTDTPFRRVVDDLTEGCGCACHTGTGYNAACRHCQPQMYEAVPPSDGCECHGGTEVASCAHCVVLAPPSEPSDG